jgi:hypothetical protein
LGLEVEGLRFLQGLDEFAGIKRKWLIKREAETDEQYGKLPYLRSLREKLRLGIINLDKPPGPTSHEVVAWVKKLLSISRAGHGGTLEPGSK